MIYFRTFAYNAEKTLEKAICSVLEQTYTEFVYYLMDNGSTDGTRAMIKKYAEQDARIVPFYADKNHDHTQNLEFWNLPHDLRDEDYFVILDADDYYEPTFLEEMMSFVQENNLDMAACGSCFFDGETGDVIDDRVLPRHIILSEAEDYDKMFPFIHWNLRQVWGKLYTAKAARERYETELPSWWPKAYGGDTINVYSCVKACDKIGVYGKMLHHYRESNSSVSKRWIEGREEADLVVFNKTVELLRYKCGHISVDNLRYLHFTHFHALMDTFVVLYNADISQDRKIELTKKILTEPTAKITLDMQWEEEMANKKELFAYIVCSVLENTADLSETAMLSLWNIANVINKQCAVFIRETEFAWYVQNMSTILRNIVLQEYEYGMNNLIGYIAASKNSIPTCHPIQLGQMLAAMREDEKKYVYFSKHLIAWWLNHNQPERAGAELTEWRALLPDDSDIEMLHARYLELSGK